MKPSFFFQLLKAKTIADVQTLIDQFAAELPVGVIDMDRLTESLMKSAMGVSKTQDIALLEELLFALMLTKDRLDSNNFGNRFQICQVAVVVLAYQIARREEKITEEAIQRGHQEWRDDKHSLAAKRYEAFATCMEIKLTSFEDLVSRHNRNIKKLENLQTAIRSGEYIVKSRLNEIAQQPQSASIEETHLLQNTIGIEEPTWGSPPEHAQWTLRGFDVQLTHAITSVKQVKYNHVQTFFQRFDEGVSQTIIEPLANYSKSQSFIKKIKDWFADALHTRFGVGNLSIKSTLYRLVESTYCTFLPPTGGLNEQSTLAFFKN